MLRGALSYGDCMAARPERYAMRFAELVKGIKPLTARVSVPVQTDDVKGRFTLPDTFLTSLDVSKVLSVVESKPEVSFRGKDTNGSGVSQGATLTGTDAGTVLRRYHGIEEIASKRNTRNTTQATANKEEAQPAGQ